MACCLSRIVPRMGCGRGRCEVLHQTFTKRYLDGVDLCVKVDQLLVGPSRVFVGCAGVDVHRVGLVAEDQPTLFAWLALGWRRHRWAACIYVYLHCDLLLVYELQCTHMFSRTWRTLTWSSRSLIAAKMGRRRGDGNLRSAVHTNCARYCVDNRDNVAISCQATMLTHGSCNTIYTLSNSAAPLSTQLATLGSVWYDCTGRYTTLTKPLLCPS